MKNTSLKYSFPTINKSSSQINNINNLSLTQSNSSLKRNQNKKDNYENILNENETDEELSIIENLWDDLGVSINYQEEFKNFIKSVNNEQEKNEYLFSEKNKLRKFRESLLKLSVEISNRENNIFKLKKYNNYLEKCLKEKKEIEVNFFDKISSIIKFLRINAVNIILQIEKIREKCSYYELKGKYNLNNANKSYLYDENYLINLPKDIKFINKSILFNYIETDNHSQYTDLFFSNCKNIITDDNKKLKIPISIELKNAINKCKYIILQDNLFNNIKNDNIMADNRNIFYSKRIGGIKSSYNNRVFVPSSTKKKISKSNSELSLLNGSDSRKFMTMFGHNKVNLSRTLYYLKRTMGNDYENLFLSSNKNKKLDMKKSGEIMDKYFHLHKQINEDENDINDNINNDNINNDNNNIILENKIDEENNFTNNNNNKIIIEKTYLKEKKENNIKNRSNEMNSNNKEKNKSKKVVNKSKSKSKNKKKEMNDINNNKQLNNINENENEIKNKKEDNKYNNYNSEKNNNDNKKKEEANDLNDNNDIINNSNDINNNDIKNNDINNNDIKNNDINNNIIINNNNKDNNNELLSNENENDKLIEKERINEENKENENDKNDNIKKDNNISEINEDKNDIENKKEEDDKNEIRESDFVYDEEEKNINNREKLENRTNKSNHSIESKGLIKYKKYTKEEIKKLNDDEDDEEEEEEK